MTDTDLRLHTLRTEHHEWRKKVRTELPGLAARIFALREKFYPGCGLSWVRERSLGKLIALTSDYDTLATPTDQIVMEIVYEELVENLATDEAALAQSKVSA